MMIRYLIGTFASLIFLITQVGLAKEVTTKRKYDKYKDKLVIELTCNRNEMQRRKPCISFGVGVSGKRITAKNSPRVVYDMEAHWLFTIPPKWIDECVSFELADNKGTLVPGNFFKTKITRFRNQDVGTIKICFAPLAFDDSERKLECQPSVNVGFYKEYGDQPPRHLWGETYVKSDFTGLNWCNISRLARSKTLAIRACGNEYIIKPMYLRAFRKFAALFPKPDGYVCFGDNLVKKCAFQECKTRDTRYKLAYDAAMLSLKLVKTAQGKDCPTIANKIREFTSSNRDLLRKASIIRDHLSSEDNKRIADELMSILKPFKSKRIPCEMNKDVLKTLDEFRTASESK